MGNLPLLILVFAALGLMMYFSMRKQKRQAAETKRMQNEVRPGARVMTTSGLHGTVTAVADDTIELEIAPDVRTTWVRAAVRSVVVPVAGSDDDLAELSGSDLAELSGSDEVGHSDDGSDSTDGGTLSLDKRRGDVS